MLLFGGIGRGGGGGGDSSRCTCLAPHPWPRLAPTRPPVPGGVAAQPRSGQLAHCLCHALVSSVRGGVGRLVGGGLHVVCARLSSGGRCGWHRRLLGTETETSSSARSVAVTSVLRLVPVSAPRRSLCPGRDVLTQSRPQGVPGRRGVTHCQISALTWGFSGGVCADDETWEVRREGVEGWGGARELPSRLWLCGTERAETPRP